MKVLFNTFLNQELSWINGLKVSPKRCAVLPPFSKFPAFVARMEQAVGHARNETADITYHKFAHTLFKWLGTVAESDDKYTDIVYMENFHFFWRVFEHKTERIPALAESISSSKLKYVVFLFCFSQSNAMMCSMCCALI